MKQIVASGLLGILLTSTILVKPASAQVEIRLGGNARRDRYELQKQGYRGIDNANGNNVNVMNVSCKDGNPNNRNGAIIVATK
jgi:hypothetical protein